jgi:hypothetical protein
MDRQIINQYYDMLEKLEGNEISLQQWYEYCTMILGVLMEENKDVFTRLKNH